MDSLVSSLHANLCTQMIFLSKHVPSIREIQFGDITVIQSDVKDDTFNYIFDSKLNESNTIKEILMDFEIKELPFAWWIGPLDSPNTLSVQLQELGLKQTEENIGMILNVEDYCIPCKIGNIDIKRVQNHNQLQEWCNILIQIGVSDKFYSDIYSKLPENVFSSNEVEYYIGYYSNGSSNVPVCTGMLVNSNNVAGIYNIATLPDYRRQGFASSMMNYLIQRSKELNVNYVTLTASPEGKLVYEPLGFQSICSYYEYSK